MKVNAQLPWTRAALFGAAAGTLLIGGCSRQDEQAFYELQDKLLSLEHRISELEKAPKMGAEAQRILRTLQLQAFGPKWALLSLEQKGFSLLHSEMGALVITCDGAEPSGDGQKLRLRIGNPLTVNISAFRLKCQYGPREPEYPTQAIDREQAITDWLQESDEVMRQTRTAEKTFAEALEAGRWNDIELIIPSCTTNQLQTLKFSVEVDAVGLRVAPVAVPQSG